ncbi:hypothetical protein ACSHWG_05215 [Leucobacter sp. Z1108]|uniref:hypothetical protein n=1 Tax=Leucobacter sp. Z1108 TaxID=3439066 RepID=UPI003F3A9DDF
MEQYSPEIVRISEFRVSRTPVTPLRASREPGLDAQAVSRVSMTPVTTPCASG